MLDVAAETPLEVKSTTKPKPKPPPPPPDTPAPAWARVRRGSTIDNLLGLQFNTAPTTEHPLTATLCAACGGDVAATVAEVTALLRKAEGRVRMLTEALEALEKPLQHARLCLKVVQGK